MAPSTPSPVLLRAFETPGGSMLGGATKVGVCLCEFADRGAEKRIMAHLEKRIGHPVRPAEPEMGGGADEGRPQPSHPGRLQRQLREYFRGERREFDLPLDLAGTPWQRKVWSALLEIPYGSTTNYGEMAAYLGKPGGGRAVGRANGQNYVAIVVPAHRVIQANGGLRGYGGGLHRKRWLLDLEAGVRRLPL